MYKSKKVKSRNFAVLTVLTVLTIQQFNVTIPEEKQDSELQNKLISELSGILNWCIEGCLKWQERGIIAPPEVTAATSNYKNDSDVIGRFIGACCITGEDLYATAGELKKAFEEWSESEGEKMTWQAAGRRLTERGFMAEQLPNGTRIRSGIGILNKT